MDLMLTSFGVSHLSQRAQDNSDIFYRMPPASLARAGEEFLPDYATLLIADRIVLDEATFDRLISGRHFSYRHVALMFKVLHDEGFVRLENFDAVIERNRGVLGMLLDQDLQDINSWVNVLKDSVAEWQKQVSRFSGSLWQAFNERAEGTDASKEDHELLESLTHQIRMWLHSAHGISFHIQDLLRESRNLDSTQKRERENRLRSVLCGYLSQVNANLLLANEFDAGFHDWSDYRPFYDNKFLRGARLSHPTEPTVDCVNRLFSVSFPEFTFWNPVSIVRALKDKRISDLRRLVQDAVDGKIEFDREFAVRTLNEVLKIERSIGKLRNFVSYATLPLDLIPVVGTPVQKVTEELIVHRSAHKKREAHRWFYFISELSEHSQKLGKV